MNVAYIITAHRNATQLARLVRALATPTTAFFVHVDLATPHRCYRQMREALEMLDGETDVRFLEDATKGLDAYFEAGDGRRPYVERRLLGPRLQEAMAEAWRPPRGVAAGAALGEFLEYERRTRFVSEYMTKVDGATMHHGLEARSPFLDQRLWEFAASLPFDFRLRGYRLKAVLRGLAGQRIGREIAVRPKRGFGVPVQRWITAGWRERARLALNDSRLVRERANSVRAAASPSRRGKRVGRSFGHGMASFDAGGLARCTRRTSFGLRERGLVRGLGGARVRCAGSPVLWGAFLPSDAGARWARRLRMALSQTALGSGARSSFEVSFDA